MNPNRTKHIIGIVIGALLLVVSPIVAVVLTLVEYLRTPEEMAAYLEACFEEAEGDAAFIAKALGDIARAKRIVQASRDARPLE